MIARNFDLLIYRIRMVTKYIMVWIVATFTKSPPQFSVYVYSIDPWEAARMVVYINVFTLGSIALRQSLLELIQNNRWLNLDHVPQQSLKDHRVCLQSQTVQ